MKAGPITWNQDEFSPAIETKLEAVIMYTEPSCSLNIYILDFSVEHCWAAQKPLQPDLLICLSFHFDMEPPFKRQV